MRLRDLNRRRHEDLSGAFFAFNEALILACAETGSSLRGARRRWHEFADALRQHAAREEQIVLPVARSLEVGGKGDPRLIEHDHGLIEESFGRIERMLTELQDATGENRTALLARRLQTLTQFQSLFEHHTVRECEFLYPALEERCDEATRATIAASFDSP